jgi:hypothetical protein
MRTVSVVLLLCGLAAGQSGFTTGGCVNLTNFPPGNHERDGFYSCPFEFATKPDADSCWRLTPQMILVRHACEGVQRLACPMGYVCTTGKFPPEDVPAGSKRKLEHKKGDGWECGLAMACFAEEDVYIDVPECKDLNRILIGPDGHGKYWCHLPQP